MMKMSEKEVAVLAIALMIGLNGELLEALTEEQKSRFVKFIRKSGRPDEWVERQGGAKEMVRKLGEIAFPEEEEGGNETLQ